MSHLDSGYNFLLDQHYPVYVFFIEYIKMTRHHPCVTVLKIWESDWYGRVQFVCCTQD